jgi:predicted GIY-YIG superfamily endonuclease
MYSIYQLVDPRDHLPRYIGITTNLNTRFQQHLQCTGSNPGKDVWIRELKEHGMVPIVEELEKESSEQRARLREGRLIRSLLKQGIPLFNRGSILGTSTATHFSLFLTPVEREKLEDLSFEYRERAGRTIHLDAIIKRLIERATVDMLL